MRRRDFITLVGGAVAWPLASSAQQAKMPVIGYVYPGDARSTEAGAAAFRQGLRETGFIEGQNVTVEYRYGQSQPDRLRELVADLVQQKVAVIATIGSAGQVAKAATSTIPVIFETGSDPAQSGLVASLNRPGGNLTGVNSFIGELWPKQLDLMAKLLPNSRVFGILPTARNSAEQQSWRQAADTIGRRVVVAPAFTPQEIEPAFTSLARQGAEALIIGASPLSLNERDHLAALTMRHQLPAIYAFREITNAGGLMSYGIDITESLRLVGVYAGRVLKGEKPANLPVVQPTRFVLAINLKTAKALGLSFPDSLLAVADEVIE